MMAAWLKGHIHRSPFHRPAAAGSKGIPLGMQAAVNTMPALSEHTVVPDNHGTHHGVGPHISPAALCQFQGHTYVSDIFFAAHKIKNPNTVRYSGQHAVQAIIGASAPGASAPHLSSIRTVTVGIGISPIQSLNIRESRTVTAGRESHPALRDILIRMANIEIFYKLCTPYERNTTYHHHRPA